jgi:hypothetical protein
MLKGISCRSLVFSGALGLISFGCGSPRVLPPGLLDGGRGGAGGGTGGSGGTGGATTGSGGSGVSGSGGASGGTGGQLDGGADSADASCIPVSQEVCFNGIDDDCDGNIDCADPACSSVAVCAPTNNGFSTGITVAASDACPIGFQMGTPVIIHQGITGAGTCDGCTCAATDHCSTAFRAYTSTTACTGTLVLLANLDEISHCAPLPAGHSGMPHVDNFVDAATCSAGGSATPSAWGWSTTMKYCPADPPGGGCRAGYACVHKSPTTFCELGSGSCTPGFTAISGGTWYTSATDNRTCGTCGCQITTAGDCSASHVFEHPASTCNFETILAQGDTCDAAAETSQFATADLNVSYVRLAVCMGTSILSGSVTPGGAQTLCCQ